MYFSTTTPVDVSGIMDQLSNRSHLKVSEYMNNMTNAQKKAFENKITHSAVEKSKITSKRQSVVVNGMYSSNYTPLSNLKFYFAHKTSKKRFNHDSSQKGKEINFLDLPHNEERMKTSNPGKFISSHEFTSSYDLSQDSKEFKDNRNTPNQFNLATNNLNPQIKTLSNSPLGRNQQESNCVYDGASNHDSEEEDFVPLDIPCLEDYMKKVTLPHKFYTRVRNKLL
jgi:hypothetical protein